MAAPTDVRVEANSQSSTVVRWTYAGANQIAVYRSPDGITYSEVTVAGQTRVAVGTLSYENIGLSSGTKYWYKISDDGGATFSSVVTVWTHSCTTDSDRTGITLPRISDSVVNGVEEFNDLAQTVEYKLQEQSSAQSKTCTACIADGALTINCDCEEMEVIVDQDVNSISLLRCDDKETDVNFIIPPNTTRRIGGWPKGMGFTGDEGFTSPIVGGATGRIINEFVSRALNKNQRSGKSKPGVTTQGTRLGGTGSGGGQQCVGGTNGELTLKVSKPNGQANIGNSLNCASADKGARVEACGGRGPYTFSSTGGVVLSNTAGIVTTVTPPANSGSGVAGTAYIKYGGECGTAAGTGLCNRVDAGSNPTIGIYQETNGCNDQVLAACSETASVARTGQCSTAVAGTCLATVCHSGGNCSYGSCDVRTAPMIAAGCNPCGVVAAGATVSVTDALGTVTTITLTA